MTRAQFSAHQKKANFSVTWPLSGPIDSNGDALSPRDRTFELQSLVPKDVKGTPPTPFSRLPGRLLLTRGHPTSSSDSAGARSPSNGTGSENDRCLTTTSVDLRQPSR